jgi:two-component system phosphate regulon sensor histidine kinase PhoR
MAGPSGGIDVRRLYLRFMVLVVLPTVGLVGFGVVAIHNERAVVEERFRHEYTQRLEILAESLVLTLQTQASRLTRGAAALTSPLERFDFTFAEGQLTPSRPVNPRETEALVASLQTFTVPSSGVVTLFTVASGPARGLYALRGKPDHSIVGIAFSETGLRAWLMREGAFRFPSDSARFILDGPQSTSVTPVNALLSLMNQVPVDDIEQGVVSLPLPGALADWRVTAQLPETDSVRTALWMNRGLYFVTLVLCCCVIAFGVLLTLRSMWREARLSRLRTDFVSNISHEMRTPLASIRMFAETLQSGRARTPEQRSECVAFITRESERLSAIAERTLDWARIEAGQQPYRFRRAALQPIVRELVDTFLARGTPEQTTLTVHFDPELPDVNVDPSAFGQVLMNLLENAVKYTGAEKRIAVRTLRRGKSVCVEVEDNGIGIGRRDARRIFDRFYRADDLLARQTEGTGLGLSIAKKIVEAHAGRLTLKSTPGQGSVFTVALPAVLSPPLAPPPRPVVQNESLT